MSPTAVKVVHAPPSARHLKVNVEAIGFLLALSDFNLTPIHNLSPALQTAYAPLDNSAGGSASLPIPQLQIASI
jgi:hypothetical protein